MKKFIALLLVVLLIIGLAACDGKQEETLSKQEATEQVNTPAETEDSAVRVPVEESKEVWGAVTVEQSVNTEDGTSFFLINFPESIPYTAGGGQLSQNSDDTITMVGGENIEYYPEIDSVEAVLPAYTERIMFNLGNYLGSRYAEMDLVVENQELVEVNGHTFCKYEGTHTFTFKKEPGTRHFVLYATKLNNSGAYAYWIVLDRSEDQSNKDLIESHAYNMALTLQEK